MVYQNALPKQIGVRTTKLGYDAQAVIWKRCRDTITGTDAVKNGGVTYLPKLHNQSEPDYTAYKTRANFFNASARTSDGMVGMIFRKNPTIVIPTSPILEEYLLDVNLEGQPIDLFAREIVEDYLEVGNIGILVDHVQLPTSLDQPLTVGLAQKLGLRPVLKTYVIENIINWKYSSINHTKTLIQVVLKELHEEPISEFEVKVEDRYRVLDLENGVYRVRVFRINERGNDELVEGPIYPLMGNATLNFIPFAFMADDDFEEPPLLDLIDVNLSHYRSSADYEHGCHFTGVPTMYVFGYNNKTVDGAPEPIYVGAQTALVLDNPEATAGFIEFTGQGLTALKDNMTAKEIMMALLGARILQPQQKATEAALTAAIHRTGENSILADISIEISLGLTKVLKWFVTWAGFDNKDVNYELNKDFLPVAIDGPTLTAYITAYQAGALTAEELFLLLQRGDLIEADVKYEEHKVIIDQFIAQKQADALALKAATPPALNNPDNGN